MGNIWKTLVIAERPSAYPPAPGLMKWIGLLLFLQCLIYKQVHSPLAWELGITITPDRLVLAIILILAISRLLSGGLRFSGLGKVAAYMLLFALICTTSRIVSGNALARGITGYDRFTKLFDLIYVPFLVFLIAKNVPHNHKKLEFVSFAFLLLGAYLAINGAFERLGLHALVWPKYILDPNVGIPFERTTGPFASSVALGGALLVASLFYVVSATHVKGGKALLGLRDDVLNDSGYLFNRPAFHVALFRPLRNPFGNRQESDETDCMSDCGFDLPGFLC